MRGGGVLMSEDERLSGGEAGISDFLKRIQAGDEGAARELLQRFEAEVRLVVRRQLPRLLAVAVRLARLPAECVGKFFSADAHFSDRVRGFAASCRLSGTGCEE